jgi:ribosomal protein L11 methyltransferase
MPLWETRVEIARSGAEAAEAALLESQSACWSLFEDVASGRAWIIGVFPTNEEAQSRWLELLALLPERPAGDACPPGRGLEEQLPGAFQGVEVRAPALGAHMGARHVPAAGR